MKGIDTNILVRFLTKDDKKQSKVVYNIFKNAELKNEILFVSLLVILELIWVLEAVYDIKRADILNSLNELLLLPILKIENQLVLQQFIKATLGNNFDLPDLLIAQSAKSKGCNSIITFDKKASKSNLFELAR